MNIEEKDIEIVSGDGTNLDFSPVSEHISDLKPKPKETVDEIVIPEVTTGKNKKKEDKKTKILKLKKKKED